MGVWSRSVAGGGVDWGTAAVVTGVWLVASGSTGVPVLWWLAYGWWRLGASVGNMTSRVGRTFSARSIQLMLKRAVHVQCGECRLLL